MSLIIQLSNLLHLNGVLDMRHAAALALLVGGDVGEGQAALGVGLDLGEVELLQIVERPQPRLRMPVVELSK